MQQLGLKQKSPKERRESLFSPRAFIILTHPDLPRRQVYQAFMSAQRFALCEKMTKATTAITPTMAKGNQTAYCGE